MGCDGRARLAEALSVPPMWWSTTPSPTWWERNVLAAVAAGRHVVVGASGLGAADYARIERPRGEAGRRGRGGKFLDHRDAAQAIRARGRALRAGVEIIDYASAKKPDAPSGTGRELAEALAGVRGAQRHGRSPTSAAFAGRGAPRSETGGTAASGPRAADAVLRALGRGGFGADNERLTIRHDAGSSAAPCVAGTLLAIRRVAEKAGLRRGLDTLMD